MGRGKTLIALQLLVFLSACSVPTEESRTENTDSLYQSYFESKEDYDAFYDRVKRVSPIKVPVRGVIAPHHLLVGKEVASLYSSLSKVRPSVVVIIGPDHSGVGRSHVTTTDIGYNTPYGPLSVSTELMGALTSVPFLVIDRDAFIYEHSINSHTAFIRRTFGNVPILPIMIHGTTTMDEAEIVAAKLHAILPPDALVIASVDFSHYIPEWVADFHDRISASAIDAFDFESIPKLEVDSPASLATLLMYLTMREAQTIVYKDHTNSASATNQPETVETTSHVFRAFADGKKKTAKGGIGMIFYGDSIFTRGIETIAKNKGEAHILDGIAHKEDRFFLGTHLSILNLESPITDAVATSKSPVVFRSDSELARSLLDRMNVNVLSYNNNHTFDAGEEGVKDTLSFGSKNGMTVLHPREPCHRFSFAEQSVALCAFDDSRRTIDIEETTRIIETTKKEVDWIVISIHWGQEYRSAPSDRERSMARQLIDAGADGIIGHGPHVVQPIEYYKERPIAYSIGNFLFDQFDPKVNIGLLYGLFLEDGRREIFPMPFLNDNGKLSLLPFSEHEAYVERLR